MEVDAEGESKKQLEERKKRLQRQVRDIQKFTDMDTLLLEGQKERWQQELQEIEQKRNDLLPEHQKMQKRSQKLHSLQDKKEEVSERTLACVTKKWKGSEVRSQKGRRTDKSWRRSRGSFGWQQMIWWKRSGSCKQEKTEEGAVHLSPMDAVSIQPWSSSSPWEQFMQGSGHKPYNMRLTEDLMSCIKPQPLRCTLQEEEERKLRKSKNKGRPAAKPQ